MKSKATDLVTGATESLKELAGDAKTSLKDIVTTVLKVKFVYQLMMISNDAVTSRDTMFMQTSSGDADVTNVSYSGDTFGSGAMAGKAIVETFMVCFNNYNAADKANAKYFMDVAAFDCPVCIQCVEGAVDEYGNLIQLGAECEAEYESCMEEVKQCTEDMAEEHEDAVADEEEEKQEALEEAGVEETDPTVAPEAAAEVIKKMRDRAI